MATHLVQQFGKITPSRTVCGLERRHVGSQTVHYTRTTCAECLARVVVASDAVNTCHPACMAGPEHDGPCPIES